MMDNPTIQHEFFEQDQVFQKSLSKAYLSWLLGGAFGFHRFYLERYITGATLLAVTLSAICLALMGAGYLMFYVTFCWCMIDAILIPVIILSSYVASEPLRARIFSR